MRVKLFLPLTYTPGAIHATHDTIALHLRDIVIVFKLASNPESLFAGQKFGRTRFDLLNPSNIVFRTRRAVDQRLRRP